MPPPEQQQTQPVAMPQVNTYLLAGDDYVYEPKPLPPGPFEDEEGTMTQSGGMASQFQTVSPALDRNI